MTITDTERQHVTTLLEQMAQAIQGAELTGVTVGVEGHGSRPGKGTHRLAGYDLPAIDHFMLLAAIGQVTTPTERYTLKVTLEVPSPPWTDTLLAQTLGLPSIPPAWLADDPAQSRFYDLVPERTVEQMAARTRARQARLADAQRLFVEDDDQATTPTDPALIQVLSRGSILPKERP